MNALSKNQSKAKADASQALRTAAEQVTAAVGAFNKAVEDAQQSVTEALAAYNAVLENTCGFAEQIVADMQESYDGRSEKWQESERGQAYKDWLDEWCGLCLDEIEIDFPDDLDEPDLSAAETLDDLPEKPGT